MVIYVAKRETIQGASVIPAGPARCRPAGGRHRACPVDLLLFV